MTYWDKEYDNRAHVADAEQILEAWKTSASAFRDAMLLRLSCELGCRYGDKERNTYDMFFPEAEAKGLVIYIHGGYWRALDQSFFSHLSVGPLAHGWMVAVPSYTLAPQAKISEITTEIAQAISHLASKYKGPIRLIGHSAGGHLVSRMLCDDNLLEDAVYSRIENTVAVSGLFDLRLLSETTINDDLRLDTAEIAKESTVNYKPRKGVRLACLVGGSELPEFQRQNELLENWNSEDANVRFITDQGKNHFTVIEPLADPKSLLTTVLLS